LRLTVDTEEDLQLIREVFNKLYNNENVFSVEKVIDLLDEHPELKALNTHVHQKELGE
jgi:spore coat polysaccharide biosynthesis protein SpsF